MRRMTWWLHSLVSLLGWPGLAGVILLLLGAVMQWIVPAKEAAHQDELRAASTALAAILTNRQEQPAVPDKADLLARFHRALPLSTTEQRTDVLARIQVAALAEGLVLDQASYLLNSGPLEPFDGLDIVLPVKGSYVQLRRFMGRALTDNPALALEAVGFNRQSVSDAAVEAQLRFTLYLQKP